ncbi:DUF6164 family protein [Marinimicrobium sp. C6131]|uniref:DUF6164 family protein n=1 Tax=Marinimicrobium sp. C6131 TaxID=3022676 RepID=UPI00223E8A4B|nr:DUF6164 family protein [Marinimicrobium sp. C6131]UZJ45973.1 DUF6164 family protein [Marinimicrobium sp. C6131]
MGQLLFKLNQVPEDEAQEVRQLLADHDFATYETHAGFWGLGVSAIWLKDRDQLPEAKALMADYQARRLEHQRTLREEREAAGEQPTLWQRAAAAPLRFAALVIAIGVILTLSILPFVALIGQ